MNTDKNTVAWVEAERANPFLGGIPAFSASILLANGKTLKVSRVGNPGRNDTPAEWAGRVFPTGMDVTHLVKSDDLGA